MNKQQMLQKMRETGFYLVDLNLYLDTHPNCAQARALYNEYAEMLAAQQKEYLEQYGPILNFGQQPAGNSFAWVDSPWPWENQGV